MKYKSALSNRNNYAIFSEKLVKFNDINIYYVSDLIYNYNEVIK
ncbi:hypothetical protein [uncultured Clostridium sp.]|nr:hypothetical protein [uncultured Clostridium sp.]